MYSILLLQDNRIVNCKLRLGRSNIYTTEQKSNVEHIIRSSRRIFHKKGSHKKSHVKIYFHCSRYPKCFWNYAVSKCLKLTPNLDEFQTFMWQARAPSNLQRRTNVHCLTSPGFEANPTVTVFAIIFLFHAVQFMNLFQPQKELYSPICFYSHFPLTS